MISRKIHKPVSRARRIRIQEPARRRPARQRTAHASTEKAPAIRAPGLGFGGARGRPPRRWRREAVSASCGFGPSQQRLCVGKPSVFFFGPAYAFFSPLGLGPLAPDAAQLLTSIGRIRLLGPPNDRISCTDESSPKRFR